MQAARPGSVISDFVAEYSIKEPSYEETALKVARMCEISLKSQDIMHYVEQRGKKTASLRRKLQDRVQEGHQYQSKDDIKRDIVDLCGARIILHSSRDKESVKKIIYQKFTDVTAKHHPDPVITHKEAKKNEVFQNDYPPYVATHYRVRLRSEDFSKDAGLCEAESGVIEIQVTTFADHAHAKAEHSAYKSRFARDPRMAHILDLWRGVIQVYHTCDRYVGDITAQYEADDNKAFASLAKVGSYLDDFIKDKAADWVRDVPKGNSWTALWAFLNTFSDKNSQKSLEELLTENLDAESEAIYTRISGAYKPATVTVSIFLMDRLILGDYGEPGKNLKIPEYQNSHKYKILAMKSTIAWLHETFVPPVTWTYIFARPGDRKSLLRGLTWLNSPEQILFLEDQPLKPNDIAKMEFLWNWFEEQDVRHIKLAFTMAKYGMREDDHATDVLERLLYQLASFE